MRPNTSLQLTWLACAKMAGDVPAGTCLGESAIARPAGLLSPTHTGAVDKGTHRP